MENMSQILEKIGLSSKESAIYLALLKYNNATVQDIANEAGIKRPTTYLILDELRKKGLVLKIPHAKRAIFQARAPDEVYEQVSNNLNNFEKILPKLRSINPSRNTVKTLYFEGAEGLKESLNYRLAEMKDKTLVGFWAKDSGLPKKILELFDNWNKNLLKYNITMGGATPDHESTRKYLQQYPQFYKYLKLVPEKDYSSDVSIDVSDDFVRIIDGHELKAVIIEDKRVADAVKQIFALASKNIQ
jgi:sugar-specific transcriptional regulator TrmB